MRRTTRRLLTIIGVIVVGIGIGYLIFWLTTRGGENHLSAATPYAIDQIIPNMFFHGPDQGGAVVSFTKDPGYRASYLEFDPNFTRASVNFISSNSAFGPLIYEFAIINFQQRRNSVTAKLAGIVRGRVMHFNLTANSTLITITSRNEYIRIIESPDEHGNFEESFIDPNSIFLAFRVASGGGA